MKAILPIFAFVVVTWSVHAALAQRPVPLGNQHFSPVRPLAATPSDSVSGDALLRRAIVAVDAQRSIAAKVRQKVDLLGRLLVGSGVYLQQGRGSERQLRLDLQLKASGKTSGLLQICDGTTLWIHEDLPDRKSLGRVDVARLRSARPKSPLGPQNNAWLALGGLPKLLMGLENSFQFGTVVENRLDGLQVWTVEGPWKPARLAQLLPDQKAKIESGGPADTRNLTPNLPDRVVLHLGCDDLFPYRIEYWRREGADKNANADERGKLLAVLEMFEVQLGAAIDPAQFAYQPAALPPIDRTQEFFDKFGLVEAAPAGANRTMVPRR